MIGLVGGGGLGPRRGELELECALPWMHSAAELQNYFKEKKAQAQSSILVFLLVARNAGKFVFYLPFPLPV